MNPGEKDGEHHCFVTKEKMQELIDSDELLDFKRQHDHTYGTTFSSIRHVMAHNKLCVITCKPEVFLL